jgi:hypothetical protein
MRKSLCATALVLALCASVYAGDIHSPPIVVPKEVPRQPFAPPMCGEPPADGRLYGDNADGFTTAALTVLNSVLALL